MIILKGELKNFLHQNIKIQKKQNEVIMKTFFERAVN